MIVSLRVSDLNEMAARIRTYHCPGPYPELVLSRGKFVRRRRDNNPLKSPTKFEVGATVAEGKFRIVFLVGIHAVITTPERKLCVI